MQLNPIPPTKLRVTLLSLALVVALLTGLAPSVVGADGGTPDRVHGYVKKLAAERPSETLSVIVQKGKADDPVEQDVVASGGRITQDLGGLNAFAAEIPAGMIAAIGGKPGVKWVSYDAPVVTTGDPLVDASKLATAYPNALMAPTVWNGLGYTGDGVGVAVIDTGVEVRNRDIADRVVADVVIARGVPKQDNYGHGTHMAGIIAGTGVASDGKYIGVAPRAKLVSVKVGNDHGIALKSDVIRGLLWVVANKDRYGIRVVNLSLSASDPQSYLTDPLDAAAELAWFSGIVVVVSAGNLGTAENAVGFAPANDPLVVTVGSMDDAGTNTRDDDALMWWSSRGKTQDGYNKPEIVAPGRRIVSLLSDNKAVLAQEHPDMVIKVDGKKGPSYYLRMGGTSTSAAMISGVVALILQAHPSWTPNQVKWQLVNSSDVLAGGLRYSRADRAADPAAKPGNANENIAPSLLLLPDFRRALPNNVAWDNVAWNNVAWNNVAWNNVAWNNVAWNNVAWNNVAWNNVAWNNVAWNNVAWNNVAWNNAAAWNNVAWDNVAWDNVSWNNVSWNNVSWNNLAWD